MFSLAMILMCAFPGIQLWERIETEGISTIHRHLTDLSGKTQYPRSFKSILTPFLDRIYVRHIFTPSNVHARQSNVSDAFRIFDFQNFFIFKTKMISSS